MARTQEYIPALDKVFEPVDVYSQYRGQYTQNFNAIINAQPKTFIPATAKDLTIKVDQYNVFHSGRVPPIAEIPSVSLIDYVTEMNKLSNVPEFCKNDVKQVEKMLNVHLN